MTDYRALLGSLTTSGVEFIVVGGAAATAHGSARLTLDLDVVYRRTPENLTRVVKSMAGLNASVRSAKWKCRACLRRESTASWARSRHRQG